MNIGKMTSKEEMFVRVLDDPIVGASATDPVVCDCWRYLRPHRRRKRNGTRTKSWTHQIVKER